MQEIHRSEIATAGGAPGIRDIDRLKSAIGAAQTTFDGKLLMGTFEIAATYVHSIAFNHPFLDDNKRTATAAGLTFLFLNGYTLEEGYDEELTDTVLKLVKGEISLF
ncbi:type II toxin-antitoxin system death-on-curing family toxin [Sediminispirochaeta smaragdinae]|uniref:type II toxin-antitoxin system death-on-curing family toxin n=1 Tax=Sediminispirochaeta smaragdinae TaxID=55206 RepID=UPI0014943674|nr:type II toxin-antitoxin system death-on-curing family toxin [Sediminispirochaeta smaragdinae]